MKITAGFVLFLLLTMWAILTPASAGPVAIEFVPHTSSPSTVAFDMLISGLPADGPPSLGAFDVEIRFDRHVIAPLEITFGVFLGDPVLEALTSFNFSFGVIDVAEESLLSPEALDELQPERFPLFTLTFALLEPGAERLDLIQLHIEDAFGVRLDVDGPGSLVMLVVALVCLAIRRDAWELVRDVGRSDR